MAYTPYSLALFLSALVCAYLAIYSWFQPTIRRSWEFPALLAAIAIYSSGYAFQLSSITLDQFLFWLKIEYLGVSFVPPLWLFAILSFLGKRTLFPKWAYGVLLALSITTIILVATNETHHFQWTSVSMDTTGPFTVLRFEKGPWMLFANTVVVIIFLSSMTLLVRYYDHTRSIQKNVTKLLLLASTIACICHVLSITGNSPYNLNLLPFSFTVCGPLFLLGLVRYDILDLLPAARTLAFQNMHDGVIVMDEMSRVIDSNPAAQALLGIKATSTIGKQVIDLTDLAPEVRELGIDLHTGTALLSFPGVEEKRLTVRQQQIANNEGQFSGSLMFLRDITGRALAEEALVKREQLYRTLVENMRDLVWTTDTDLVFTYVSPTDPAFGGFIPDEAIGKPVISFMPPQSQEIIKREFASIKNQLAKGKPLESGSLILEQYDKYGGIIWTEVSYRPIYDKNGDLSGLQGLTRDITQRKLADEALKQSHDRLAHLATHDPLTDLANRVLCEDRLTQAITSAQITKIPLAFLMIDLDGFKEVNDSLGHAAGDEVLKVVARRMQSCVRKGDLVCRLAGDEFAVLLENICNAEEASLVAKELRREVAKSFLINDETIHIDCSIGIALFPNHGSTPKQLTVHADHAMYAAKQSVNHICVIEEILS